MVLNGSVLRTLPSSIVEQANNPTIPYFRVHTQTEKASQLEIRM